MKKRILTIVLFLIFITTTCFAASTSIYQKPSSGGSGTGIPTGTNCIAQRNSSGTAVCSSSFNAAFDDSAAQITNSSDATKKVKIDASNQGTGQTGTIQAPVNGTFTATAGTGAVTVASGTSELGTAEIASGACATVVTTTATGVATTDVVDWGFNADPTSTTGYAASANGMLTIIAYPTANNVNFKVCNNTAAAITPGAVLTLNFKVRR